ncbi:MAG: hypothetical protein PHX43_05765 [Alphaproteobacteria bacterium]|nr:hypothetical protein [Alphaproteobacteria bacterium]
MYLIAFVVLMISLLGVFVQIYAVQTAQMFANQRVIGQLMIDWHSAAVGQARNSGIFPTNPPCRLNSNATAGMPATFSGTAICLPMGAVLAGSTRLPPGYSFINYQWFSMAYIPTGSTQVHVVTFVPPTTQANIPVPHPNIGITTAELLQQVRFTKVTGISFGFVQSQRLVVTISQPNPAINYSMPSNGAVPEGSIAIVSVL